MASNNKRAKAIRLVIFDVDGVLTDGSLFIGSSGEEYKVFNSRDGHGMVMLLQTGVKIAIITGRASESVRLRMADLGIEYVYQGCKNKLLAYQELKATLKLKNAQIAYVGDDVVDLPVMLQVGLAIAVQDANPLVRQYAHWCTKLAGGRGAVREVCEFIMAAQGTLAPTLARYTTMSAGDTPVT